MAYNMGLKGEADGQKLYQNYHRNSLKVRE